jgi:PmbA protein
LIEQGILKQFLTDSVHAQKMNLPHTASAARGPRSELGIGPSNLLVSTGQDSLEQLLSRYPRVIYITEFKGFHSSYQKGSGDFSFPSEGELWENGKKVGPLAEFVTSGNILELLSSIEAVSARIRHTDRSIQAPDLLVYGPSQGLMVAGRK